MTAANSRSARSLSSSFHFPARFRPAAARRLRPRDCPADAAPPLLQAASTVIFGSHRMGMCGTGLLLGSQEFQLFWVGRTTNFGSKDRKQVACSRTPYCWRTQSREKQLRGNVRFMVKRGMSWTLTRFGCGWRVGGTKIGVNVCPTDPSHDTS